MRLRLGETVDLAHLEPLGGPAFHDRIVAAAARGARLGALTYLPPRGLLVALLLDDAEGAVELLGAAIPAGGSYPALSARLPEAQAFERAIHEDHGLRPEGHPWLKPLRAHAALDPAAGAEHGFFRVEGPGEHEVAVGPVHAGIIEPGHFRFQCAGETVHSLEIHLGYQRRGVRELLRAGSPARRLVVAESIAGDTSVGHALAHCQVVEKLARVEAPLAAQELRGVAVELERVANHVGDLGALCNDVGYLPGASWFGRLRGDFLNLLVELSGNRFGRGLLVPGGVRPSAAMAPMAELLARLGRAEQDLREIADLMFSVPSVVSRFEGTGALAPEDARLLGLVGPAARACGAERDVRLRHPQGIYRFAQIPIAVAATGDVMARALVRRIEAERSIAFVRERLGELREGPRSCPVGALAPARLAVSLVEGWRGEIVHLLATGDDGEVIAADVVDPSLHNWFGLAVALRGNPISDFPLCNKSFNLSYAGHDL